jgi:proteasome lid subunit RPN8/RPN11
MVVLIHQGQLNYFRRKCLNSPNEQLAYLVGNSSDGVVTVAMFVYPKILRATPSTVEACGQHYKQIAESAKANKASIVGSIHSHPNSFPIMSQTDYEGHIQDREVVSGIVEVTKDRKTRVAFWSAHSALPCELHYI